MLRKLLGLLCPPFNPVDALPGSRLLAMKEIERKWEIERTRTKTKEMETAPIKGCNREDATAPAQIV
mgnify:FL=1